MKLCATLGSQLCSNLHLGYFLVVPKDQKLNPVGWTVRYKMMKWWYWLIIDGTRACMHLYFEKVEIWSVVTDTIQIYKHWKIVLWNDCYIVGIWNDSWYVVWFHPRGLFPCSKSLSLSFELLSLIILAISCQFAEVPFSPTNVVRLRVFHDFCLFGNAGNDDEQWVEAMALSYQRCITRCPRAVSWVIPRTEVWLWPSSYKALLICA